MARPRICPPWVCAIAADVSLAFHDCPMTPHMAEQLSWLAQFEGPQTLKRQGHALRTFKALERRGCVDVHYPLGHTETFYVVITRAGRAVVGAQHYCNVINAGATNLPPFT